MPKKRAHRPAGHPGPTTRSTPGSGNRSGAGGRPRGTASTGQSAPARTAKVSTRRESFERRSAPILLRMQTLPAFVIPVVLAVTLFFGLVITSAWAGILLLLIAVFLTWLTAISWPAISAGSRLLRVGVDLGLAALGVLKLMGRL